MAMQKNIFSGFLAQIFWRIMILIILLSALFTWIIVNKHNESLTQELIDRGLSHAKSLAAASELGVFAENSDFLRPAINRTIREHNVIYTAVYTASGKMLAFNPSTNNFAANDKDANNDLASKIRHEKISFYRQQTAQGNKILEFWSPVTGSIKLSEEELLLSPGLTESNTKSFGDREKREVKADNIIGMVMVRMSQEQIRQQLQDYIYTGISITLLFLPIALLIAYLMAKEISAPLLKLIEGVELIEHGDIYDHINIKATNEIGRLSSTFNRMVDSLKRKDREISQNMQRLSSLNHIASSLNQSLDIKLTLSNTLKEVLDLTGADIAYILLKGIKDDHLALASFASKDKTSTLKKEMVKFHEQVVMQVIKEGYVIVEDADKENICLGGKFQGLICIPIVSKGKINGNICILSHNKIECAKEDVDLLCAVRDEINMAVQNSRLYEKLKDQLQKTKKAQQQLISTARLASIGELAANVAHEVNNPLTGVLMHTCLMIEENEGSDKNRERLKIIQNETMRIRGIVRNLLDFTRQSESKKSATDITEVIQDTIELISHTARASNIAINSVYKENLPTVFMDSSQIKQVLLNIINNALYAIGDGGTIDINTSLDNDMVKVEIHDTGSGIPKEVISRLFEPFFTTKPETKGTGLGLSVSLGIIEEHGGSIAVASDVGQGSLFTVKLPTQNSQT